VNTPNCEIIRGEVSIFRGGAGGLSYLSSGSFNGAICNGANWAEAVVTPARETSKIDAVKEQTVEVLIS